MNDDGIQRQFLLLPSTCTLSASPWPRLCPKKRKQWLLLVIAELNEWGFFPFFAAVAVAAQKSRGCCCCAAAARLREINKIPLLGFLPLAKDAQPAVVKFSPAHFGGVISLLFLSVMVISMAALQQS